MLITIHRVFTLEINVNVPITTRFDLDFRKIYSFFLVQKRKVKANANGKCRCSNPTQSSSSSSESTMVPILAGVLGAIIALLCCKIEVVLKPLTVTPFYSGNIDFLCVFKKIETKIRFYSIEKISLW